MKKILKFLGNTTIGLAFLFFVVLSFTGFSKDGIMRDIFGFIVPTPPVWTSYIPFVSGIIGFISEYFSIHGLITIFGTIIIGVSGFAITGASEKINKPNDNKNENK